MQTKREAAMGKAIDWDEAAVDLKREVGKHRGFLTMQKDKFKKQFDIGHLTEGIAQDLLAMLDNHGMIVLPHPYYLQGTLLRVYDVASEIGKIARAITYPQEVPETALVDAVCLYERAAAGKRQRSVCVPWLSAFDVFLQLVIGRPPDDWEVLDDDLESYQLVAALAASLKLRNDIGKAETVRIAGAVWACRPRVRQWEGAQQALAAILAEAARKQKFIFDGMLRDAAKHLLGGAEIPSCDVDLGKLGLRYRCETQGDI
jgi:hypothetical protein